MEDLSWGWAPPRVRRCPETRMQACDVCGRLYALTFSFLWGTTGPPSLKAVNTEALPFSLSFFVCSSSIYFHPHQCLHQLTHLYPSPRMENSSLSFTGPGSCERMAGCETRLTRCVLTTSVDTVSLQAHGHTNSHRIVLETFYWKCENRKCIIA